MAGWANFHGAGGDVHIGQLAELVIHAGQLALHVVCRLVRNVEKRAAVFSAASFADFGINGACNHITCGKLHARGIVLLHEALAIFIA